MREEENEREEGAVEDDLDEYGNKIGGESVASAWSVALVRSMREKKWWAERRSSIWEREREREREKDE